MGIMYLGPVAEIARHIFERYANDRPGSPCRVCGEAKGNKAVHI